MAPPRRTAGKAKEKRKTVSLIIGPFRMAFPALFTPEEDDYGNEKYKLTALLPPDSKSIREIEDAMYDCMVDAFGPEADWPSGKKDTLPEDKFYDAGKKDYQGFKKGWMALSVSSQDQPGIIDIDKQEVLSPREVYGGRWARAQVTITTFDNVSKGCTAYLNHVQLLEHDEAFNGRGSATDAFADDYKAQDRGFDDRGRDSSRGRDDSRGRGRDEDDEPRGRDRERGSRDEDRGRSGRDRDEGRNDRGSRDRSRDDDDRAPASRDRDRSARGEPETGRRGGRDRDDTETSRGREESRRGHSRDDRDAPAEDRPSRARDRDRDEPARDDDRPSRGRDTESPRGRGRDDGERPPRDARDDRGRSRAPAHDDDDWN
jgi:hypothetical protein